MGSKLDDAIERLRNTDDWEDSSVNVHVEVAPPKSKAPQALRALSLLPPWGRVLVTLLVVLVLGVAGLLGRLLGLSPH